MFILLTLDKRSRTCYTQMQRSEYANDRRVGQKQASGQSLGEAYTKFYAQSPDELVPTWLTYTQGSLFLHEGLAHLHLGSYQKARDSFEQVVTIKEASETARIEALISQVTAEVTRDDQPRDMEYCIERWTQGIQGAIAVQSHQWFNVASTAHTAMQAA